MGGGESKTPGLETMTSRSMFGMLTAQREAWWTSTSSSYENITSVGDALTTCYSLLESSWSMRSEGLCFLNEYKLRHSLSSCKTFLNLVCLHEIRNNAQDASYWFHMNLDTSILSTLMFITLGIIVQRLRRSNHLRAKMEKFMPTSKNKETSKAWYKPNKNKKKPENNMNNLPFPQIYPY